MRPSTHSIVVLKLLTALCLALGVMGILLGGFYKFVHPESGPNFLMWVISFLVLFKGLRNWFRLKDISSGNTL
jgi:Co/Zn/Cd efflux system component